MGNKGLYHGELLEEMHTWTFALTHSATQITTQSVPYISHFLRLFKKNSLASTCNIHGVPSMLCNNLYIYRTNSIPAIYTISAVRVRDKRAIVVSAESSAVVTAPSLMELDSVRVRSLGSIICIQFEGGEKSEINIEFHWMPEGEKKGKKGLRDEQGVKIR